jgi:hypothetical protein
VGRRSSCRAQGDYRVLPNIAFRVCHDRIERSAAADRIEAALAKEPIEKADKNDPMQPTDSTEPTEPIERIEPHEPILKIEFSDLIERSELEGEAMPPIVTYAASSRGTLAVGGPPRCRARGGRSVVTTCVVPQIAMGFSAVIAEQLLPHGGGVQRHRPLRGCNTLFYRTMHR